MHSAFACIFVTVFFGVEIVATAAKTVVDVVAEGFFKVRSEGCTADFTDTFCIAAFGAGRLGHGPHVFVVVSGPAAPRADIPVKAVPYGIYIVANVNAAALAGVSGIPLRRAGRLCYSL